MIVTWRRALALLIGLGLAAFFGGPEAKAQGFSAKITINKPPFRPGFPGRRPGFQWNRPGYQGGRPGRPEPGRDRDRRRHRRWDGGGIVYQDYYQSYGLGYWAGGRAHHEGNWRYMDVRGLDGLTGRTGGSTDYRTKLYYDRLTSRDFRWALDDLALGVFGALVVWPDNPYIVAHSYALERLFKHLDMKLEAKMAYAGNASAAAKAAYGQALVREQLAKLVDGIVIEGPQYLVRFRLPNGKTSPWVVVPVVFPGEGAIGGLGEPGRRQGAFYYEGAWERFEPQASAAR
jgi:hypothetical protein